MTVCAIAIGSLALVGFGAPPHKKAKASKTTGPVFADVEKVLAANCVKCHSGAHPRDGLDLTTYAGVMKGSDDGPVVVVGSAKTSVLYKSAAHLPGAKKMPPRGVPMIAQKDAFVIADWINAGAKEK